MESSYNHKKIIVVVAAAAMFGVGPALATTTTPVFCNPSEAIDVSEGSVVAKNQNYKMEGATQTVSGTVVKYAEADSAICLLDDSHNEFTLTGLTTEFGVVVAVNDVTVNLDSASIASNKGAGISFEDGFNATLKFKGNNYITGFDGYAGIAKTSKDGKLIIDGSSKENSLSVNGGAGAAGIGGNVQQEMTSNIEVWAGTITAKGGQYGAAIGGGQNGAASNITIGKETDKYYYNADDALTLSVTGGNDGGAGIGGGSMGGADKIVINNGYITANAPATAAIGAGAGMNCMDITINNGVLHAVGGAQSSAIGADGTTGTSCSGIVINNGSINAYAGSAASGDTKAIGKKESVTITGGSIMAVSSNETYDDIMDPKDAQGSPVHRFNIKATEKADDSLFVRSTTKGKFSAEAAVAQGEVFENGGDWDNGKFFPTHHLDVDMNAGAIINQQDQIWVFLGEHEEHDLMVNPSVTGELEKTVASSGKTSRIKWDATQSKFIYNIALLNSFPHDFLVYNGNEQRVKVDSSKIWIMGPDSSAFVTLSKSSSESKTNNYFKLNGDSLTNANVKCQEEFVSRSVSVTGTTGAPVALYCDPAGFLTENAPENVYTMTAKDDIFYGAAKHEKFMLPYVLKNMEIANSIEPQSNDEKDPIALEDGYDHLVYNGTEQIQAVASVTLFNKNHYKTDAFQNYVLVAGVDYEVSENKGTDASKFDTLKISANGTNFVGSAKRNFVINPFDLANAKFTFNPDSLVYNMGEQTQKVDSMFICAGKAVDESCYKLGSNPKDLYEISGNAATNAGEYNAKVAKVCEDEDDFCSNVTNEVTKAFNIAKFPADSLKIAFAYTDPDTLVYNGTERTQKFDVSLKTLVKKPVKVAEEGAPTFVFEEVAGQSASSTVTNLTEFDTTDNKKVDAGKYTLTITAKDEANFEGAKSYDWRIGARDLAGNVWGISSSASTVCANYDKCVAGDESVITANVGKYGCRAVYPCDRGFEGYAKASVTSEYKDATFNARWLENKIKNVKFANVPDLADMKSETEYVILTADSIKDHEADSIYNDSKVLSNFHLNVRGNDPYKDYCIRHVHTDGNGNKLVCHNPYMSDNRIAYYSDDGRGTYQCTEEYADYGADGKGTSDYCASFETQEACDAGKRAAGGSNVSTSTERCYDYQTGTNTKVERIYIAVGGVGNFKGIDTTSYVINPADIGENLATIVFANDLTYNAKSQEKIISKLTIGDFDIDGDIVYRNFLIKDNVKTEASDNGYNMVITGIKNYKGTAQANWGIAKYDITGANVTPMFNKVLTYNPDPLSGNQIQKVDSAFIVIGDTTVKLTYSSSSKSVKDAGNYTIDLHGSGNFTGTYAAEFTVAPFDILKAGYQVAVTSDAYVSEDGDPTKLHVDYPVYNDGETITQKFAVWTGAKTLNETTGEKVNYTYTGNVATEVGVYDIVVTGQGNYTGTISTIWTILDKEAVLVTIVLKNDTVVYDAKEHVWGGKDIIKSATYVLAGNQTEEPLPFEWDNIVISEDVSIKCTNVNDECSYTVKADDIKVKNYGKSSVTVPSPTFKLVITQAPVTVAVAGKNDSVIFDNQEHKLSGYDITIPAEWAEILKAEDVTCTVCDTIARTRTSVGVDSLGLTAAMFDIDNSNFNVTFDVTDGKLVIEKASVEVAIAGKSDTATFDNQEHKFLGYDVTIPEAWAEFLKAEDIICTGCDSVVGRNANEYALGLSAEKFASANGNFDASFDVTDGKLVIEKALVPVKIVSNNATKTFNGKQQKAEGFTLEAVNASQAFVSADSVIYKGDSFVAGVNVGEYALKFDSTLFESVSNNYAVKVMELVDGKLSIEPAPISISVVGKTDSVFYDSKEHSLTGYDVKIPEAWAGFLKAEDITCNGCGSAVGTNVGEYPLVLKAENFKSNNDNFTVDFNVTNGSLVIDKAPIEVKITGKTETKSYAAKKFMVSGYNAEIAKNVSNAPFNKSDIVMLNGVVAEASGTDAGKYPMGLKATNFAYNDTNYNVTFTIASDGELEIKPAYVTVTIEGARDTVVYDGKVHSVSGYTVTASDSNFGSDGYEFIGKSSNAEASGKNGGVFYMALADTLFKFKDKNFTGIFVVKNGAITIVKPKEDALKATRVVFAKVHAIEGGIVVDNAYGKAISVFSVNGKAVYNNVRSENTSGSTVISVPRGMYVVKVGSDVQRVTVK